MKTYKSQIKSNSSSNNINTKASNLILFEIIDCLLCVKRQKTTTQKRTTNFHGYLILLQICVLTFHSSLPQFRIQRNS